jgi:glycosyltransferase involved in cell wall biosynthesis
MQAPDRPRISLVLHKFSRGGSDRVAAYLANGFRDAGMDVELTVLCRGGEVENYLVDLVEDIPIRYLGRSSRSRAWDLVRTLPALVRHLRALQPDAVISTANNTALACATAVVLAGLKRTRLLLKTTNPIASSRHRGLAKAIRRWTYRLAFRRTTAVWTLSADEADEMRLAFPAFRTIFRDVFNPYVTPAMLADAAPEPRGRGKQVISIARLTEQKRLDRLVAAFARTASDLRLLILGEGEDRAALEAQAASLGVADRIAMPGYVPDVAKALHQSDLFILTSDYEGLPAAVLEAMAANCPVLCTDCFPAARSLLEPAEGCAIIESTEADALARQIETAAQQPRPTTLRAIAERYSIANGVRSHVEALRETLSDG